jgi:hypothetical protein
VIQFLETTLGTCPDILREVVNTTPKENLVDWKILWRDPESQWTSPKGRIIQLGDAAHTFVPSSGNGATQAIEDAMSLASCLEIGGKSNVPIALRVHNLLRSVPFNPVALLQVKHLLTDRSGLNGYPVSSFSASETRPIATTPTGTS